SRTTVWPLLPAGHSASAPGIGFGFGAGVVLVGPETVGSGAVGSVPVATVGTVPLAAPGPRVTLFPVATTVFEPLDRCEPSTTATTVATTATPRKPSAGHIQSPGYHGIRRCQADARTPTRPRLTGSRSPHSRQYSWSGS